MPLLQSGAHVEVSTVAPDLAKVTAAHDQLAQQYRSSGVEIIHYGMISSSQEQMRNRWRPWGSLLNYSMVMVGESASLISCRYATTWIIWMGKELNRTNYTI